MTDLREYFPPNRPRFTISYQGKTVGSGAFGQYESSLVRLVGRLDITDGRFPYKGSFDIALRLRAHQGIAMVVKLGTGTTQDHHGKLEADDSRAVIRVTLFERPLVATLRRNNSWSEIKIEAPGLTVEASLVPLTAEAEADLPADLLFDPATMPLSAEPLFEEEAGG